MLITPATVIFTIFNLLWVRVYLCSLFFQLDVIPNLLLLETDLNQSPGPPQS